MSDIATAYVQIVPTSEGIGGKLKEMLDNEANSVGASSGSKLGSALGKGVAGGLKAIGGLTVAMGAAVAGVSAQLVSQTAKVAEYGDNIDKMSQKMGISAEAYQEWDAVMQHSGTSMETMKASMKTLASAAETGKAAFTELGISQEEIAKMSQQDLFEATIAGLQNVEDETQRTYLAGQLLGKGATELGALLNTSAEDTQAMRDRVRELGGVMSEDAVKQAAAFQDQLQDMQTAFSGISRNIVSEFMPGITTVMSGLTELFNGNSEAGLGQIAEGINDVISRLTDNLPAILDTALGIVEALAQAIIDNLPVLMDAAIDIVKKLADFILVALPDLIPVALDIVMKLADTILQNLPAIIETGLQVIVQLALGIAQALPTLIPTIVEVVLNIAEMLIDNIDMVIDAAIQLIIGLAMGLIEAIPIIIEKAPIIIGKLAMAIIENLPKILEAGVQLIVMLGKGLMQALSSLLSVGRQVINNLKEVFINQFEAFKNIGHNIVQGIRNGIANAWNNLVSWFKGLFGDLIGIAKRILGIASPSKVFEQIGEFTTEGFDEGMANFGKGALNDVQTAMDEIANVDAPTIGLSGMAVESATLSSATPMSQKDDTASKLDIIADLLRNGSTVNVSLEGDAQGLFNAVRRETNLFTKSTGKSPFAIA